MISQRQRVGLGKVIPKKVEPAAKIENTKLIHIGLLLPSMNSANF
jgi:hypothetical protein